MRFALQLFGIPVNKPTWLYGDNLGVIQNALDFLELAQEETHGAIISLCPQTHGSRGHNSNQGSRAGTILQIV